MTASTESMTPGKEAELAAELYGAEGVADALKSDSGAALAELLGETTERGEQEFVLRTLRACDYVVPKAAHVLISILKWRGEHGLPAILDDGLNLQLCARAAPYWPVGYGVEPSNDGCLLEVWRVGQFWPSEFLSYLSVEEIRKLWLMHMERGLQRQAAIRKRLERPAVNGVVLVFDLAGMSRRHLYPAGIRQLTDTLAVSQRYYVENVRAIFVVNAGKVFEGAWKIIKKTLSPNTVAKVSVHADSGLDAMVARMGGGAEKLPLFLGGQDDKSQIGNVTHVGEGEVIVKAGTIHMVVIEERELPPGEENPILQVMFETEDYPIDFGVLWYPSDKKNKEVELLPFKKYNSHVAAEKIEVPLPGRGILRLAFDNEEAMFKGIKAFVHHQWKDQAANAKAEKSESTEQKDSANGGYPVA